jgi:hypothetical protein
MSTILNRSSNAEKLDGGDVISSANKTYFKNLIFDDHNKQYEYV